uniref:Uncharacterized protein n=1 Tax=Aegilops tauschii subsp. strangulata TaxID=200361 RepID=A0A453AF22_AEGTS
MLLPWRLSCKVEETNELAMVFCVLQPIACRLLQIWLVCGPDVVFDVPLWRSGSLFRCGCKLVSLTTVLILPCR